MWDAVLWNAMLKLRIALDREANQPPHWLQNNFSTVSWACPVQVGTCPLVGLSAAAKVLRTRLRYVLALTQIDCSATKRDDTVHFWSSGPAPENLAVWIANAAPTNVFPK